MLLVLWYVQPYALAGHGPYSCSPISRHVKKYQGSRLMKHDEVDRVKKAGGAWTVQQTEAGRHRTAGQLHQGSLAIRSSVVTAEWAIRCGCRWRRAVAQEQWSLVVRVLRISSQLWWTLSFWCICRTSRVTVSLCCAGTLSRTGLREWLFESSAADDVLQQQLGLAGTSWDELWSGVDA